jgi:capsular exopolysaccharide synthesis family protein
MSKLNGYHKEMPQNPDLSSADPEDSSEDPATQPRSDLLRQAPAMTVAREAYRTIRSQVMLSRAGEPPKHLLITSALPGEGKTITAVNTATTFAHKGRRVLLIDADLRKGRCHELLRCRGQDGLAEVLTGQVSVGDVIADTGVANLFFLRAGDIPPDPPELLGSVRMQQLLVDLGSCYDHIIVDSAPVLPVSDSVALSTYVDGVMIIAGRATSKHLVRRACVRINAAGAKVLGIVLNQVNARDPSYYPYGGGYHGYSYYSGKELSRNGHDHAELIFY